MWNLLLKHEKWPRDRNKSVDVANIGFDTRNSFCSHVPVMQQEERGGERGREREEGAQW